MITPKRLTARAGRHQTLEATLQWSHDLLTDAERTLFDRLGVFAGTFDVSAVERVCADDEVVDELDVIDLVASLVDKSMVIADRSGPSMRYRCSRPSASTAPSS